MLEREAIKAKIRAKVVELASRLGSDASSLRDDEVIPVAGILDSAAILELVVWYDECYEMHLSQEEINIDNLGSIDAMSDYVLSRKAP